MACTDEMLAIAERLRPHQVTLVPERREEITTEGGLDVSRDRTRIARRHRAAERGGHPHESVHRPRPRAIDRHASSGASAIELHTGPYAHARERSRNPARRCVTRRAHGASIGLAVHAGHGLTVENVGPVAAIPEIEELNIGHSVVSRAVFVGLVEAVRELRAAMDAARRLFLTSSRAQPTERA